MATERPASTKMTKNSASQMEQTGKKSRKPSNKDILNEEGGSGTQLVDGFLSEEFNAGLRGTVGLDTYDEMRKSDGQINATLLVLELPIRSTRWYVDPAKDEDGEVSEEAKEVAKFVEDALFEKMEMTFDDFLREVLTMLPFGFSVFEKVYKVEDDKIWIKKLGSRKQTTIQKWTTKDGAAGVTQWLNSFSVTTDKDKQQSFERSIPDWKLLIFSYRKEGNNYAGTSVLRSAYKHWYIKDTLYRFDAVRHERQSVGIPVVTMPDQNTPDDKIEALSIVRNVRSTEQTGVVLPGEKWKFEFADTKAGSGTNLYESINHHNREISKNILAQFLELGNTATGSRSLSEDQSDLFLQCEEAIAKQIRDTLNRFLIKELVDYNFDVEDYPKLQFDPLGGTDMNTLASALATLAGSELITPDEDTEVWLRKKLNMPPKMKVEEVTDEMGNPIDPETGLPIEPTGEIDPETGEPIEPVSEGDDELDALEAELDAMDADSEEFYEVADALLDEMMFQCEVLEATEGAHDGWEFVARGQSLDDATKKKISETLKRVKPNKPEVRPLYKKGDPLPQSVKDKIAKTLRDKKIEPMIVKKMRIKKEKLDASRQRMSGRAKDRVGGDNKSLVTKSLVQKAKLGNVSDTIKTKSTEYKAKVDSIKSEIEAMKASGKVNKAKVKELKAAIKKIKEGATAELKPLKEMKAQEMMIAKNVKKLLAARKKEIQAQIKQIREGVKNKTLSIKAAILPLREQVKSNTAKISELIAQKKRAKGDKEKLAALKQAIEGVRAENTQLRNEAKKLRGEAKGVREAGKSKIESMKKSSGLYSEQDAWMFEEDEGGDDVDDETLETEEEEEEFAEHDHDQDIAELYEPDAVYQRYSELVNNEYIIKLQNEVRTQEDVAIIKKKGFKFNDYEYEAWRPLTFAERKVNFQSMKDALASFESILTDKLDEITTRQKEDLLNQVKKAVENNDVAALGAIKAKYKGEISQAMTDIQKELFEIGKKNAATEMSVKVPPTKAEVKGALRVQNDAVVDAYVNDLESAAKKTASAQIAKKAGSITNTSAAEAVGVTGAVVDKVIDTGKSAMKGLTLSGALNLGRSVIFERYPEKIYGFQFSAIIDAVTSDICLSLDGRVVKAGSREFYELNPPLHDHCRSLWVEILNEETFKPKFTSIPKSIPRNTSPSNNPKKMKVPVVLKGSPAVKQIQAEIEERKEKLQALKASGKFKNRQEQHSKRIAELTKAIDGKFHEHMRSELQSEGIQFRE